LFLKDACCGSQFDLQGRVQGGPATRALRQYNTSISGNLLSITN
jgi:Rieske Fe-S protein